jgi:hypothetical protein
MQTVIDDRSDLAKMQLFLSMRVFSDEVSIRLSQDGFAVSSAGNGTGCVGFHIPRATSNAEAKGVMSSEIFQRLLHDCNLYEAVSIDIRDRKLVVEMRHSRRYAKHEAHFQSISKL